MFFFAPFPPDYHAANLIFSITNLSLPNYKHISLALAGTLSHRVR